MHVQKGSLDVAACKRLPAFRRGWLSAKVCFTWLLDCFAIVVVVVHVVVAVVVLLMMRRTFLVTLRTSSCRQS
jgi:hypothetical protein